MEHLVSFILVFGVVLCGFIIFSLIRTKSKELPQRILIVFWVFILATLLHFYGQLSDLQLLTPVTYPLINISQMFLPVLIFLYVKSIIFEGTFFFKKNSWHLLPTTTYFLFYTFPYAINLFTHPDPFEYVKHIDFTIITLLKDAYGILYFILSLAVLCNIQHQLKQLYSHIKRAHLLWLNTFLHLFFGVIIIDFIFTISEFLFSYQVEWDGYITAILLIISMFYLAYYGIKQISVSIPEFLMPNNQKNAITSEHLKGLEQKLKLLLDTEKPYLLPNLTLGELAQKVGTSEKTLSHFLNHFLHTSFYDLINGYRVEEAKSKLKSGVLEQYSMEGIGSLCGFSSKSSFYRVFKKETGLTPLNYKKQFD
ncbi:MAG: AraC family transcriptional regulator [Bacteroidota bacterium]